MFTTTLGCCFQPIDQHSSVIFLAMLILLELYVLNNVFTFAVFEQLIRYKHKWMTL